MPRMQGVNRTMITCSKCGNVEYDCVHRSKIIRQIMRLKEEQSNSVSDEIKRQYTYCITYLEDLIE
jgi:hypothetical protein